MVSSVLSCNTHVNIFMGFSQAQRRSTFDRQPSDDGSRSTILIHGRYPTENPMTCLSDNPRNWGAYAMGPQPLGVQPVRARVERCGHELSRI